MSQGHTHCQPGKRVYVRLFDGTTFVDKFVDHRGRWIKFEFHRVRGEDVRTFTIFRHQQPRGTVSQK